MSLGVSGRRLSDAAAFALIAVGYFVAAVASIPTALPPSYAAPFYPAAGLGLAAVMLRGRRMLPAVALGAFGSVLVQTAMMHRTLTTAFVVASAGMAVGAALQSYLGALLIRRQLHEPEALAEPHDIVQFVVAVALACVVSTTIGNLVLLATGRLQAEALPGAMFVWWVGDLLGVLIAMPVILALRGQPREAWVSRRISVGVTLTALSVLVVLGMQPLMRRERARDDAALDRDLDLAVQTLTARWTESLHGLEALRGVYLASEEVTAEEMRRAAEAWLASGASVEMDWSVPVRRADIAAFEASMRASGLAGFRVHDAGGADPTGRAGDPDELIVARHAEPRRDGLLGLNLLSVPGLRATIEQARRSDLPTAGPPRPLPAAGAVEVVVYRAVYPFADAQRRTPAARAAALIGLASVSLRPGDALGRLAPALARALGLCLVDATPGHAPVRIGGPAGCESRPVMASHTRGWRFADRDWQIRADPAAPGVPGLIRTGDAWLFSLITLVTTAMLGGFLLTVTGRARRIEVAVRERTAALQAEVQDRIRAENALRESEQRFRNILDHVPIGVVYTDLDGTVRQVNLHLCRLLGRTEAELLGTGIAELTHPDDREQSGLLQRQLLRDEIALYRRHERYLGRSGEVHWVQATVCLLRGAAGRPRSIVSVIEDVTEHRLLEEAERGREAAEAANRAKSDFLSRMSHELRTPLNAMLGFAQLLELDPKQPLSERQKPWVTQIQQAGWHLLEMINDVLDLSRIESGNLRLRLEPLDLGELLAATLAMVDADARARGLRITQHLQLGGATPIGDPTRVKQILTNLLTNAVKYNADGGGIAITGVVVDGEQVQLVVADTGLGMTPEQLADLFQPFNRLGRERSAQAGTGIGLVISQRLAELMGGSLAASSRAGEGSAFILTLPCSAELDTVPAHLGPPETGAGEYPRRRVCYVEDNETNVEVMRGILTRRPQVELSVALTGLDGLALIRTQQPHLILLDMHLPDIDGLELLRHLRREPATRSVPIAIVSADALPEQIAAAFDAGCDRYLTKPVNVAEVLSTLDDFLVRAEAPAG